jgi:hypothetical protein
MRTETLKREADKCRRKAQSYSGKPEAAFLLRLASSFEELALCRPQAN